MEASGIANSLLNKPTIVSAGRSSVQAQKNRLEGALQMLNGDNVLDKKKALGGIISVGNCDPKIIPLIINLLNSNDPQLFGLALKVIALYAKKGGRLLPLEKEQLAETLQNAKIAIKGDALLLSGKNVILPGSNILNYGTITFKSGKWMVDKDEQASINGVEFTGPAEVFFDGLEHSESKQYVSFSAEDRKMAVYYETYGTDIVFSKDNPYLHFDNRDVVSFDVYRGSVVVVNRDADNIVPLFSYKASDSSSVCNITDGSMLFELTSNGLGKVSVYETSFSRQYNNAEVPTSSPLQIDIVDRSGERKVLEAENEQKPKDNTIFPAIVTGNSVLVNNYAQVSVIHDDGFGPVLGGKVPRLIKHTPAVSLEENERVYTAADVKRGYPQLEIEGKPESEQYKGLLDALAALPPKVLLSLKKISIYEGEDTRPQEEDQIIYLNKYNINESTFIHEAIHAHHQKLNNEDYDSKNAFSFRWMEIAGDHLGRHVAASVDYTSEWADRDENRKSAAYGFVAPYGGKNIYEDVATMSVMIIDSPYEMREIIAKASPEEKDMLLKKMDLLLEFGFITQAQYDEVLPTR
jgi:hypothetical protein